MFIPILTWILLADPIAKKVEYDAALGASKVKLYKGPGSAYPLLYILMHRHYPVKVVGEFDGWCRVKCPDGETGWIRKCYLSTKYHRSIVTNDCLMYNKASETSTVLAKLHKNVFVRVKKQEPEWAYIVVNGNLKGWTKRKNLW